MWLALHAPDRVDRIVLANTNARSGRNESWDQRIARRADDGHGGRRRIRRWRRWFTEGFRQRRPETVRGHPEHGGRVPARGLPRLLRGAARRPTFAIRSAAIRAPALVVTGAHDPVTPPAAAADLRRAHPARAAW